jgi:ribosomal RNA-processing protein 12
MPAEHRKLLTNIRKKKERAKRRKDALASGEGDDMDVDENEEEAGQRPQRPRGPKEEADYEELMNKSESEDDEEYDAADDGDEDDEEDYLPKQLRDVNAGAGGRKGKPAKVLLKEGDDEPLDFLSSKAVSHIMGAFQVSSILSVFLPTLFYESI